MRQSNDQTGVTLLELIVVLALFSIVATLTFEGLSLTVSNKIAVEQEVETQSNMAFAHRAISSAIESMAPLSGNQNELTFYLDNADSAYFPQATIQKFVIQDGKLKFKFDSSVDETDLIDDLDTAGFYFGKNGERLYDWDRHEKPNTLGLEWTRHGKRYTWLFDIQ